MKTSIKILSVAVLGLILNTSCNKNTACGANVVCKDANGQPVKGADVYLFANIKPNVDGDITAHGVTDDNGKVSFVFKLPAIFDIKASVSSKTAKGMIKLEEGNTIQQDIIIQ